MSLTFLSGALAASFTPLGHIPGANGSGLAQGVSDDGSVIVGWSDSGSGRQEAFRWTAGGGIVGLGDIPDGQFQSDALGVSADGSVVVGLGRGPLFSTEAYRWTADTGMVSLGHLPGGFFGSSTRDASGDGSVVVGFSNTDNGNEAFVWTQADGMKRLIDVLVANSATGLDGWLLTDATAISADGQWVAANRLVTSNHSSISSPLSVIMMILLISAVL